MPADFHAPTRRELLLGSGVLFAWASVPRLARAEGRDPRLLVIVFAVRWTGSVSSPRSATRNGESCAATRGWPRRVRRRPCRSTGFSR